MNGKIQILRAAQNSFFRGADHNSVQAVIATLEFFQPDLAIDKGELAADRSSKNRRPPCAIHLLLEFDQAWDSAWDPIEIVHWYTANEWRTAAATLVGIRKWSSASVESNGYLVLRTKFSCDQEAYAFRDAMAYFLPVAAH